MAKTAYQMTTPADVDYKREIPAKCENCLWRRDWVCARVTCIKDGRVAANASSWTLTESRISE